MNQQIKIISALTLVGILSFGCYKKDIDDYAEINRRILEKKGIVNSVPNGGNGGGINSLDADTIFFMDVPGNVHEKVPRSFNCPAGVSKMTVKTICSQGADCSNWNPNYADMFVSFGSVPEVSEVNYNYTWTADCASILPNNEEEICNFYSPQAGTWNVVLYGYNLYFISKLVVIVEY